MTHTSRIHLLRMNHHLAHLLRTVCRGLPLLLCLLASCGRPTQVAPELAFREVEAPETVVSDDLDFAGLADALSAQQSLLEKSGGTVMRFGKNEVPRAEYAAALRKLIDVSRTEAPHSILAYIKENFRFFEWYGGPDWGDILLTGYFEPIIPGSVRRTELFTQPLYGRPDDLIVVDLKTFSERFKDEGPLRGRVRERHVVPYFSRSEIDDDGALKGRNLELCWVDPVDAFFLHIQGSGTVRLADGEEIYITYAEKNGQRYEPVGKFLKERIAPHPVTMQRIEAIAREMSPSERSALFAKNPSYVFFTKSKRRAITSLGVPATPGRTIAVDPRYAPKGAIALLTFHKPDPSKSDPIAAATQVSRFVVDQDSGGAIKGTDHVDLFWGRGDEAKKVAGILQDRARILYLMPKR